MSLWLDIGLGALGGALIAWHLTEPKERSVDKKHEDICPECGAKEACYSCVTQGGWRSRDEEEKYEREQALERTPD